MRPAQQWVGKVTQVRKRLIGSRGVRDQVGFQNDVNCLLAAVAELETERPRLPHGIEATAELLPVQAIPNIVGARQGRPRSGTGSALAEMARMRWASKLRAKSAQ
ncbi:MAG TPA: hypothetical protein VNO55_04940 [Polyangia bacterium]|nr:hypothetical protein [Polyangia bacterium]